MTLVGKYFKLGSDSVIINPLYNTCAETTETDFTKKEKKLKHSDISSLCKYM